MPGSGDGRLLGSPQPSGLLNQGFLGLGRGSVRRPRGPGHRRRCCARTLRLSQAGTSTPRPHAGLGDPTQTPVWEGMGRCGGDRGGHDDLSKARLQRRGNR